MPSAQRSAAVFTGAPEEIAMMMARLAAAGFEATYPRPAAVPTSGRGLADWQVNRATRYMRDHMEEDVALATLAELVGLSRFHFCTAFRLATGQTPHERLTNLRIERARDLLTEGDDSITEIALAVGYQTPSAFAARFRKQMGVTPSDYRRRTLSSFHRPVWVLANAASSWSGVAKDAKHGRHPFSRPGRLRACRGGHGERDGAALPAVPPVARSPHPVEGR